MRVGLKRIRLLLTPLVDILKQDQGSDPIGVKYLWECVETYGWNPLWMMKQQFIFWWKRQLETSRIYKNNCISPDWVTHKFVDSKRFGWIREAVQLDKREHGRKQCTFQSFDSHGEYLQVKGSIPVPRIMFHRFWVRFCISNQCEIIHWCVPYWC